VARPPGTRRGALALPHREPGAEAQRTCRGRRLEAARRRHDALVLAVEDSVDRFLETTDEADRVTEIARRQREESAAAIREASERVVQAVDHFEQVLGAARWCADPQTR
jgi:hypothetical protein